MIGIGIDTGGTYTDAVVYDMDKKEVLCAGKALTTKSELEIGIAAALDTLNQDYVKQAEMLALSTTLATNACVEDKGSRAKLLMIGTDPDMMEKLGDVYASYGFRDMDQLAVLDGKPEKIFREPKDPDWEELKRRIPEEFSQCKAIGVVQVFPQANGGRFEKEAKKVLEEEMKIPVTTAYDMFNEVDVLKRGAGTLLNARLIPLITEFLQAVKNVMKARDLHMPIAIVRSDGSLMSEELAKECPVETLLSGPAASVVGGSVMAHEDDAIIVDMGGTTTDVAVIRERRPVTARQGISIGKWKTMVKGLYVDTFGLGGDSAVRFKNEKLFIDTRRVIPISLLAKEYPQVTGKLNRLAARQKSHTRMLHEFYVLQKDITGKTGYTEDEQRLCAALKEEPLMGEELAEKLDTDIYLLHTERLEEEGIVMKSGLTPTDMMVVKGDFTIYTPEAARSAITCLAQNVVETEEKIPDKVYDLVEKKMYCNIVRILLQQKYPKKEKITGQESIEKFIEWSYNDAKSRKKDVWMSTAITTKLPIVGVGAPIHVFLPRVAKLLGTRAVIRENAPVANALGAIASQIVTKVQTRVKAEYKGTQLLGYSVYEDGQLRMFEEYKDAEKFAVKMTKRQVLEKAKRQGASESPKVKVNIEKFRNDSIGSGIFFESIVEAVATDEFRIGQASSGK
ncbi:MAG: hydantoinase/oxoprolinase family protein [Ruminococcus sp.]|jgi:N-methylhydantoinase A/oxoprolinase/acetone carboxylase beta subunit